MTRHTTPNTPSTPGWDALLASDKPAHAVITTAEVWAAMLTYPRGGAE